MTRVAQVVAGVPVTGLEAAIAWYTRLFGRPPDMRVGDEVLWDLAEAATVFIEPDAAHAGAGRITMVVAELDAVLSRLDAEGVAHGTVETYANGVRHVTVPDPDGNRIALAEVPAA